MVKPDKDIYDIVSNTFSRLDGTDIVEIILDYLHKDLITSAFVKYLKDNGYYEDRNVFKVKCVGILSTGSSDDQEYFTVGEIYYVQDGVLSTDWDEDYVGSFKNVNDINEYFNGELVFKEVK